MWLSASAVFFLRGRALFLKNQDFMNFLVTQISQNLQKNLVKIWLIIEEDTGNNNYRLFHEMSATK